MHGLHGAGRRMAGWEPEGSAHGRYDHPQATHPVLRQQALVQRSQVRMNSATAAAEITDEFEQLQQSASVSWAFIQCL